MAIIESGHSNAIIAQTDPTPPGSGDFVPSHRNSTFAIGPDGQDARESAYPALGGDAFTNAPADNDWQLEYDNNGPAPLSGNYCCKLNFRAGDVAMGGIINRRYTSPTSYQTIRFYEGDECWVRWWLYLPSSFIWFSTPGHTKFARKHCFDSAGVHQGYLDLGITNGGNGFRFENSEVWTTAGRPEGLQSFINYYPPGGIPKDQWVAFEWYTKISPTSAGAMRLYMNRQLMVDFPNTLTISKVGGRLEPFFIGTNYNGDYDTGGGSPVDQAIWADNIAITSQSVPPVDTGSDGRPIIGYWSG